MTDGIQTDDHQPEHMHGVVEAFLDGEVVDPSLLRDALADQAARDHFIDLLVIRQALNRIDSKTIASAHRPQGADGRGRRLAAVAAAAIVSVSVGYFAGQRVMASATPPATVEAIVVGDGVPAAPKPTRSITLKPGLNWSDSSGGR